MLVVSARLFSCSRLTSSEMLTLASEPKNLSSSIFASSSAIGCSNSRKFIAMKMFPRPECRFADHTPNTTRRGRPRPLVYPEVRATHAPAVRQIELSCVLRPADEYAEAARTFQVRLQQLLEAAHSLRTVELPGP